jgi:hypothetical protein
MPSKSLVKRLTQQVGSKPMAIALLKKRGDLTADNKLTPHGKARQALGAAGRAKDRAAKASGHPATDYKYNSKTNRARLK